MTKNLIDPSNLKINMNKINPKIILESLVEINSNGSLNTIFSDKEIFLILKYLSDYLAENTPSESLKELKGLKIYKPLWFESYVQICDVKSNNSSNVYLISEEMAALMKRCFKTNPFETISTDLLKIPSLKSDELFNDAPVSSFKFLIKHKELAKLYTHLQIYDLNDLDFFSNLCIPLFFDLNAKIQFIILEFLSDEILEKKFFQQKDTYLEILRKNLVIQTKRNNEPKLVSELYDSKSHLLKQILDDSYFPDEAFESPQCLKFLKRIGLRTCLSNDLCKILMNEIEYKVSQEETGTGWTEELRKRSKCLYLHLVENWQMFDESILLHRFLEPYCPNDLFFRLAEPFEYSEFSKTCINLNDAELQKYEHLIWSSSFILPSFVQDEVLNLDALNFFKLNRKPDFLMVNQNLTNLCQSIGSKEMVMIDEELENFLIKILLSIYKFLDQLSENNQDICKQLNSKEIIWSTTSKKFVSPEKICIELEEKDEIIPFLYSLSTNLKYFKKFLLRLGAVEKPYPMLYGNILKKMAYVCKDDYLNSNELCKALKAEVEFFKYLKINDSNEERQFEENEKIDKQIPQTDTTKNIKLTGLFFVSTEVKFEKSGSLVIFDNNEQLNYALKLPNEKYLFNPSEKLFKINTNEIRNLLNNIHPIQRPILFSQKYEENYDFSLPEDPNSQNQNILICIECYYMEMFHGQQFHRSLARIISDKEARQSSPKYLSIDDIQKLIEERLSLIKFKCVEHLETSLSCNKSKKLEQTIEEKACYLTYETTKFITIYINKKHVKQPYFPLCLARTIQPILEDLNYDHSLCASLIASNSHQITNLLQLAKVSTEDNILLVIKQQYVPSSGKFYADDISLLSQFNNKQHDVLVGDLCVYLKEDGAYLYCKIIETKAIKNTNNTDNEIEFTIEIDEKANELIKISQDRLFVLENWKRVNEAVVIEPPNDIADLQNKICINKIDDTNQFNDLNENVLTQYSEEKFHDIILPKTNINEKSLNSSNNFTSESILTKLNDKKNVLDSLTEANLWLNQAKCDLESAYNDMNPLNSKPVYEWVCYKAYRAVEKMLRAYHCFKGNGNKLSSTIYGNDLRRLLLGTETNVRDLAFKFCNIAGNESKTMQNPNFEKISNEGFISSQRTKCEKALNYGNELVKLVDIIISTK